MTHVVQEENKRRLEEENRRKALENSKKTAQPADPAPTHNTSQDNYEQYQYDENGGYYDQDYYDEEREEMEKIAQKERQLGRRDYVTDMNREIYVMDALEADRVAAEIEAAVAFAEAAPWEAVEDLTRHVYAERTP